MAFAVNRKYLRFRWLAADLTLNLSNAPWLANALKLVGLTTPNGTGLNARASYTGSFGGATPGGTLTKLVQNADYELIAGLYNGWTLPSGIEIFNLGIGSSGASSPYTLTPTTEDYSQGAGIAEVQSDGRLRRASFAVLECDTNAGTGDIGVQTTGSNRSISVFLVGKLLQTLTLSGANTQTFTLQLPGNGYRRLKVVEGTADRGNEVGPILGTGVLDLTFPANTISVFTRTRFKDVVVVHGDSISNGAITPTQQIQGWVPISRTDERAVVVTGYGAHTAMEAFGTDAKRARSMAQTASAFAEATNKVIYIALGTNDFSYNSASPAGLATALGQYIDAEHALDAAVRIIVQTPLVRTDALGSGANAGGFVIQDYRDALTALGGSRSWLTVVDGVALLSATFLDPDGVHPGPQGHVILSSVIVPLFNSGLGNLGLPNNIPWARIFSAEQPGVDLVTGAEALTVANGFGTPEVVTNGFGTKPAYKFVRNENDALFFNVTTPSAYYLLVAAVNSSSYDVNGFSVLLSAIPGDTDPIWSLTASSSGSHVQGKIVPAVTPLGSRQVVVFWVDANNLVAKLMVGDTIYTQALGDAPGTGGLASAATVNRFKVGSHQGAPGYALEGLVGAFALAPGRYTDAQAIQVAAAFKSAYLK